MNGADVTQIALTVSAVLGTVSLVGGIYALAGIGWAGVAGGIVCYTFAAILLRGLRNQ